MRPWNKQAKPQGRWTLFAALLVAAGLGLVLLWAMQSAFQVGDDMIASVEESKLDRGPRLRASARREEAAGTALSAEYLRGVVRLPDGVPPDEKAWLEITRRSARTGDVRRVDWDAEGRFAVPLDATADELHVELRGRYLHLEAPVVVPPGELARELTLRPRLGGRLELRVDLPESLRGWLGEQTDVRIDCTEPHASAIDPVFAHLQRRADGAVGAEFGVLPAPSRWTISTRDLALRSDPLQSVAVEPGATAYCTLPWHGSPALRVEVWLPATVHSGELSLMLRRKGSGGHGRSEPVHVRSVSGKEPQRFLFSSLEPGTYSLRVEHPACMSEQLDLGLLDESSGVVEREILLLTRAAPGTVRGQALWPDDQPAAYVQVFVDATTGTLASSLSVSTAEDGRFEIGPLEGGNYRLSARAWRELDDESAPANALTASLEVAHDQRDVVLRLREGARLRGVVVDTGGVPWTSFQVVASPVANGEGSWLPARQVACTADSGDGSFELVGVYEGEWDVCASSRRAESDTVRARVGAGASAVRLTMPRLVRLAGRVVDMQGLPIEGARVTLHRNGRGRGEREDESRSDRRGGFELFSRPGTLELSGYCVRRIGAAPSAAGRPTRVPWQGTYPGFTAAAGEVRTDIELVLDAPGSIACELVYPPGVEAPLTVPELVAERGTVTAPGSRPAGVAGRNKYSKTNWDWTGLTAGPYRLRFSAAEWQSGWSTVNVIGGEVAQVTVAMQRAALLRIDGSAADTRGWEVSLSDPNGLSLHPHAQLGRQSLIGLDLSLPPGLVDVTVRSSGGAVFQRWVTLESGVTTSVEVEFKD